MYFVLICDWILDPSGASSICRLLPNVLYSYFLDLYLYCVILGFVFALICDWTLHQVNLTGFFIQWNLFHLPAAAQCFPSHGHHDDGDCEDDDNYDDGDDGDDDCEALRLLTNT